MHEIIAINEIFGPTIQGEGADIGRPCMFIRVHHCPVRCPGCDTSYTWNGKESAKIMTVPEITDRLIKLLPPNYYHKPGLILSGGEPLLYYQNAELVGLLNWWKVINSFSTFTFTGLETSGWAGPTLESEPLGHFLNAFSQVSLSPKITPCLRGRSNDLGVHIPLFKSLVSPGRLFFKFVVRDKADIEAILAFDLQYNFMSRYRVYLMPYGNDREEILKTSEIMIPMAAKYGWIISPRLQALLWGAKRGV